jgi:hypothetical protein
MRKRFSATECEKHLERSVQRDEIAGPARLMLGGKGRQRSVAEGGRMTDRLVSSSTTPQTVGRVPAVPAAHEELVADARASLRPAEMVERKLLSMLRAVPMPVSMLAGAFRKR